MAWESTVTLEDGLAFGRMGGKVSLILEKPGILKVFYELSDRISMGKSES